MYIDMHMEKLVIGMRNGFGLIGRWMPNFHLQELISQDAWMCEIYKTRMINGALIKLSS